MPEAPSLVREFERRTGDVVLAGRLVQLQLLIEAHNINVTDLAARMGVSVRLLRYILAGSYQYSYDPWLDVIDNMIDEVAHAEG